LGLTGAAITIGRYVGELAPKYRTPELLAWLAGLPSPLEAPSARVVAGGRNRHIRVDSPLNGGVAALMVKSFGTQPWFRDLRDHRRGSKARRTWLAATHLSRHGVGTPQPIGYLERWEGTRLRESYFIAGYQGGAETFLTALLELFHEAPECEPFMALLECVANGVRGMHDAGFLHNDLGAQNILLIPEAPRRWRDFQVVDLNRGRIRAGELNLRERARDLSRLGLPSHLLQVFMNMYWRASPPPELRRWQGVYRWLRSLHSRSRWLRHPIKEARLRRQAARISPRNDYPALRDMWIWDERSAQPIAAVGRNERLRLYPASRYARVIADTVRAAPGVWREYRSLLAQAFAQPVALSGRIGMAVNPSPEDAEREISLLAGLGRIPAFVRFYHHEGREQRQFRARLVHALQRAGHPVVIALVQDRKAVREPAAWREFAVEVLESAGQAVEAVEIGQNINRAKWGIWDFRDVKALYAPIVELRERFPALRFIGPGAIDFEYPFVLSALREWPAAVPLAALSHHLYVDRRGAPENPQGAFGPLEKFALARAIARHSPICADRVVISEVNWPLAGTGVYSPILAPYLPPGAHHNVGGASEDEYGDYMLRYLCLALGSGMVDSVYWWRLVAHGFGLVDDRDPGGWRPRPAYAMLRAFLHLLGESTLVEAQLPGREGDRHGRYRFAFRRPDGEIVALTYAHGPSIPFPADEAFGHAEDAFGQALAATPARLAGRPIYLRAASYGSSAARR
jgi:hypothetical protein